MDVPSGVLVVLLFVLARFRVLLPPKLSLREGTPRALKTFSRWFEPKAERASTAFPPHRVNTILLRFNFYLIAPAVVGVYPAL